MLNYHVHCDNLSVVKTCFPSHFVPHALSDWEFSEWKRTPVSPWRRGTFLRKMALLEP